MLRSLAQPSIQAPIPETSSFIAPGSLCGHRSARLGDQPPWGSFWEVGLSVLKPGQSQASRDQLALWPVFEPNPQAIPPSLSSTQRLQLQVNQSPFPGPVDWQSSKFQSLLGAAWQSCGALPHTLESCSHFARPPFFHGDETTQGSAGATPYLPARACSAPPPALSCPLHSLLYVRPLPSCRNLLLDLETLLLQVLHHPSPPPAPIPQLSGALSTSLPHPCRPLTLPLLHLGFCLL